MKGRDRSVRPSTGRLLAAVMCAAFAVALALPTPAVAAPTWSQQPSGTTAGLNAVSMVSADEGWAVGTSGTILHYSGGTWSPQPSGTTSWLTGISMVSASEGWAVGYDGTILHYSDGTWSAQDSGTTQALFDVDMVSASEGWAVGMSGTILHYSGGTWSFQPSTGMTMDGVSMVSADEGWAVGVNGTILHYSGGTWSPQASGIAGEGLPDISMVDATEGWATRGSGGTLLHYSDGAWSLQPSGSTSMMWGIDMLSANEGWAVGFGTILHYTDGAWSPQATPYFLNDIAMLSPNEGWAVGFDGVILHYSHTQSEGVGVSAEVEMSLTFSVAAGTSPEGGSATASALDFGGVIPGTAKSGSHRLSATCNAPNGYTVTAAEDKPLGFGAISIPNVLGDTGDITESTAGAWADATTYGFGYTLTNVSGTPAAFTTGYKQFADVSAGKTAQQIMSSTAPRAGDSADVTYKLNCAGDQMAGAYSNVVTYMATANY